MTGIGPTTPHPVLGAVLLPLGLVFLGLARLRAWGCRIFLSPKHLGRPTVSIGNLTFGGTGKTPLTIALVRMLQSMGERPAVLLRGYGRTTRGARLVSVEDSPERVGEEAILLARSLPGVPVAVGERREEAAVLVGERCSVFLLDDGFQHLRVHRDLDLLLVDATRPQDLHAPPMGRLREPLGAARRASAIVITRGTIQDLPPALATATRGIPTVAAQFDWDTAPQGTSSFPSWKDLAGLPLIGFAGIGNPEAFFRQAQLLGLSLGAKVVFPDHSRPSEERRAQLLCEAKRAGARAILTTEKDAVKWAGSWSGHLPLVYPRLTTSLSGDVDSLRTFLTKACKAASPPRPTR